MWDEYGLGLQPQSLHFTMTYWLGVAQISSKIPKAWLGRAAVTWWGHIHMHIHSIWRLSNTFHFIYKTLMWDEYGLGIQPQSLHFTMTYWLGVARISIKIRKAWSARAAVSWWGHIHMHIHSIWRFSNTFYIYGIDVRWIWFRTTASITAFHHELLAGSCPDF